MEKKYDKRDGHFCVLKRKNCVECTWDGCCFEPKCTLLKPGEILRYNMIVRLELHGES